MAHFNIFLQIITSKYGNDIAGICPKGFSFQLRFTMRVNLIAKPLQTIGCYIFDNLTRTKENSLLILIILRGKLYRKAFLKKEERERERIYIDSFIRVMKDEDPILHNIHM